jgi:hypothetical protein
LSNGYWLLIHTIDEEEMKENPAPALIPKHQSKKAKAPKQKRGGTKKASITREEEASDSESGSESDASSG